ncbi:MAG TPA: c-type cytochrome [Flavisolibacter sp.]|jgi:hypothetical protein|nr:c-type cytochrome [Flavisolibacter sp.]
MKLFSHNKKIKIISGLCCLVFFATATIKSENKEEPFKNLKVLPKNISSNELNRIMVDEFSESVGMTCTSCHAKEKGSERLDYASDTKPEKQIARNMMRMTLKLNRKYFGVKHPLIGSSILSISCNTCHKGEPIPDETK